MTRPKSEVETGLEQGSIKRFQGKFSMKYNFLQFLYGIFSAAQGPLIGPPGRVLISRDLAKH